MKPILRPLAALLAGASITAAATAPAMAEEGQLRIAEQFGLVYLLLNVANEKGFIAEQGKAAGVDIKVEIVQLSGGAAVNDALLSGSIDVAAAGVGPLFTIWDRTRGDVKGIASLGNFPNYLVSNRPEVKTIADLTDQDRIALPAVGVSVQARILQMAAAKQWGDDQFERLDEWTVALPHPEAASAIISGGTEITGHFANPPFPEQELAANPNAHTILSSYDVLGGPSTSTLLYATSDFYEDSPKTYGAFIAALDQAAKFVTENPEEAADIYLNTGAKTDRQVVLDVIKSPDVTFTVKPQNTLPLGQFLHTVEAIRTEPTSVSEYFVANPLVDGGS